MTGGRPARIPPGMRVYAIGDIHGRDDLLADKHWLIRDDLQMRPVARAVLIHVGDYVDRGPQSRQVIDRLIRLGATETECVFIKGNHEEQLLGFLDEPLERVEIWMVNGGGATLESYDVRPPQDMGNEEEIRNAAALFHRQIPREHMDFLRGLALTHTLGDYFFCHAGVRPDTKLDRQDEQDLLWIRDEFLLSDEDFGKIIVHGHTPSDAPQIRTNRIGIDTMAVFSGKLTCVVLEGEGYIYL
jgi:serine/threonine protein phosphatase 1